MIEFKKIRIKNFGSFGNSFSEIELDNYKLTLVTGTNGHGKSFAFLDSITFALFGKPFRPVNIPQLINSINNKNCVVEIDFFKGKTKYMVRRGLAPKIFEIYKDDILLDQNAKSKDYQEMLEQNILSFGYAAFKQVVILGKSSFTPFMQLTPAERRKIIEGLLDLDILAEMATVVKGKLSDLKGHIQTTQSLMTITNEKLKSQKEIQKQVKQNYDDLIDRNNNKIVELQAKETTFVSDYNVATKTLTELKTKSAELDKKIFKFKNFVSVESKLSVQYDTLCAEILTTESQQSCSCCGQDLTEAVKCEILRSKYSRRDEYKTALKEVSVKLKELTELEETKEELQTVLKKAVLDQTMATREKQILQNRIEELTEENADLETKHLDNNEIYDTIKTTEQEIKTQTKIYQTTIKEQIHYDVVYDLLRDGGLKSKIIRHYVPVINNFVNKYLEKLNLYVDFNLNQEFKETIKSRYRDEFSYLSFSEGEKQRIDLAILMTWREIAKMKNSLNCNLLIFDEILDSSLDATGTENFLKILTKMKNKCSVFIISHKSDQLIDKFDQGIQIEKKNNFSRIKTT